MGEPPGIRGQRGVHSKRVETQGQRTTLPLGIVAYGDHQRSVGGAKELVRDEIRVRVAPSRRVAPGDERVLCDVHQCATRTVRERYEDSAPRAGSLARQ